MHAGDQLGHFRAWSIRLLPARLRPAPVTHFDPSLEAPDSREINRQNHDAKRRHPESHNRQESQNAAKQQDNAKADPPETPLGQFHRPLTQSNFTHTIPYPPTSTRCIP